MLCGALQVTFSPGKPCSTMGQVEFSKRCHTGLCLILPQSLIKFLLVLVQMVRQLLEPSRKTLKRINLPSHFIFLACFGGNCLWGKPKPVHSRLPPSFHFGCLTENIPVLTPAYKLASVSVKGSGSPPSGTTTAAASDPNLM